MTAVADVGGGRAARYNLPTVTRQPPIDVVLPAMRTLWLPLIGFAFVQAAVLAPLASGTDVDDTPLQRQFERTVQPFLAAYCHACHRADRREAMLDLTVYTSIADVTKAHPIWEHVLERLETKEMPPQDATRRPDSTERAAIIAWIHALRSHEAARNAGDPGVVLARRLSHAEYNYTIRDLTGVDIGPTRTFPVDPANEAGFDNTGESLTMSPALLDKYLAAARQVAEHMVLTPTDLTFAPHPAVTETDRDKFCVKRIVAFYEAQPTDLSRYFFACWRFRKSEWEHAQDPSGKKRVELHEWAAGAGISEKYAATVWEVLCDQDAVGPIAELRRRFEATDPKATEQEAWLACERMRDYVLDIRPKLASGFENLMVEGNHKGSQPFVLWKNRQYAAHRQSFDRGALRVEGEPGARDTPAELVLPSGEAEQARHLESVARFCAIFPDAWYISERGRDYLDVPREKQEKGRLLSAGFHSMVGYFRDDRPLYDLILDERQQRELDRLWQELDFVASVPGRQYSSFLWFERTDSRYMRDPEFDFARAEDKNALSEAMIRKLADLYIAKARRNGGSPVALQAIEDYFRTMNDQIRWMETARRKAEPVHLDQLLRFAERAWRRKLLPVEEQEIRAFYQRLRHDDHLDHEEAIRDSVVSILMAPHFIYRVDLASVGEGTRLLTGFELASRLSYFLWSTLPDDELISAMNRSSDSPKTPAIVVQQARRMLGDERIRGLATEFMANWLDFRRFQEHNSVDRIRFPEFTDELRQAMFEEPIHFFVDLVQNDRSVLELLHADHTFVNFVLAQHYGIKNLTSAIVPGSASTARDALIAAGCYPCRYSSR